MIHVAVVAAMPSSLQFLERRVGGILKNIANIRPVMEDDLDPEQFDLIIVHHLGGRAEGLREKFSHIPIFAIEPAIMPAGIKLLMTSIRPNNLVGVVAEHQRCANKLMTEIIQAGMFNRRFVSGTYYDIEQMKADQYVTSEEMIDGIPRAFKSDPKLIVVPRMISHESSTQLITLALTIEAKKRGRGSRSKASG